MPTCTREHTGAIVGITVGAGVGAGEGGKVGTWVGAWEGVGVGAAVGENVGAQQSFIRPIPSASVVVTRRLPSAFCTCIDGD